MDIYSFQVAGGGGGNQSGRTQNHGKRAQSYQTNPECSLISTFIGKAWEIISNKLPEYTSPDNLLRFAVSFPTRNY